MQYKNILNTLIASSSDGAWKISTVLSWGYSS